MSVLWMTRVWKSPAPTQPTERLMLLALADNANDEGVCWPAVGTLRRKCGMGTERGARKVLDRLLVREPGALPAGCVVVAVERRGGRTSVYQLSTTPERGDRGVRADRGEPADRTPPDRADRGGRSGGTGEPSENRHLNQKNNNTVRARRTGRPVVVGARGVDERPPSRPVADGPAAQALIERGVAPGVARQLAERYPARVSECVAAFDRDGTHGPGWLVKAIRSGWSFAPPVADGSAAPSAPAVFFHGQALAWLTSRGQAATALTEHFEPAGERDVDGVTLAVYRLRPGKSAPEKAAVETHSPRDRGEDGPWEAAEPGAR